jgi:hypothetical protein
MGDIHHERVGKPHGQLESKIRLPHVILGCATAQALQYVP